MAIPESPTMQPCGTALDPQTYFGVPWRSVVTSLDGSAITLLDRLASNRSVTFNLNAPATAAGQLPSDNPQVNIPFDGDDEPFVTQSARLLYMMRREGTPTCWVPRFGGIMFQMQDQAGSDVATTSYTAFDPWQVLYHRPVLTNDGNLDLPGPNGVTYKGTTADLVVADLLNNMYLEATVLGDAFPEAFIDFGQTAFYTGTMETAHAVTWVNFQQSASIGEALDQLTQAGLCDIWFSPVYDPVNRPGIVAELNVYMLKGSHLNSMIMAWDKPPRSLVGMDALYDGNTVVNRAKYFPSQGPAVPLEISAASIARFGPYWEQSMFNGTNAYDEITAVADAEVILRALGKSTYEVTPVAGRSPIPLLEYGLGDMLPVWASNNLRKPVEPTLSTGVWDQMARVYGIQISLDDNDMERVEKLVLSKDST